MILASVFAIVVGVGMIGQWGLSLAKKRGPEVQSEPYRIGFHLAGEFATAITLLIGGVGLLAAVPWGRTIHLVSLGMLLHTLMVSPGYFAQRREWPIVGLFAILLVLALVSLGTVI